MNTFDILGFIIAIVVAVIGSHYALKKQKRRSLDGYLVKKLEDGGVDITLEQPLQFCFYSNEANAIQHIADELKNRDFEVVVNDTEADPGFIIHAYIKLVPDIAELQKLRADFNKIARRHGGKYDGWGYSAE